LKGDPDMNWLRDFLELSSGTEVPSTFSCWCGLSTMSMVLKRSLWIDMGVYTVFPNMFVVLVAGSGRCKKSTAINIAENLIRKSGLDVGFLSQKSSPERLIGDMMNLKGKDPTGLESSSGVVVADEIVTFLNKRSYESGIGEILIPLYDCKESFEYRTISRGIEKIQRPCLGLLGGTTIDCLRDDFPKAAVGGGLTSRIIFIYQDIPPAPVAWTTRHPNQDGIIQSLQEGLRRASKLSGEMVLDGPAKDLFIKEYEFFYENSSFYDIKSLAGYASRRGVHLLKIALVLSIIDGKDDLVIREDHIRFARNLLTENEPHLEKVMNMVISTDKGSLIDMVRMRIHSNKRISRSELLRSVSHQVSARELDEILATLFMSDQILVEKTNGSRFYVWKGEEK